MVVETYVSSLDQMNEDEEGEQTEDDTAEDTPPPGGPHAPLVLTRRPVFLQTTGGTASAHPPKEATTTAATTGTSVLVLRDGVDRVDVDHDPVLITLAEERSLHIVRIRWETTVVVLRGHSYLGFLLLLTLELFVLFMRISWTTRGVDAGAK